MCKWLSVNRLPTIHLGSFNVTESQSTYRWSVGCFSTSMLDI